MTYLSALRLHFAGQFQAAVSTVNNDPTHFDNARFTPEFQKEPWNPRGDADWRLVGCAVTSAWHGDGSPADAADPIVSCRVADSDRAAPAKLVDLDPQQQLVSEIWGLEMRICDPGGSTLVRGRFEPAAFADIWNRSRSGGGDIGAGAMYQSVLSELEWGDVDPSPFLVELGEAAADGLLSVKFNVDSYNMNPSAPDFMLGRVVGTIGPGAAGEPHHFVAGRQLMARRGQPGGFFVPAGQINHCAATVDEVAGRVHLDVGNALPGVSSGGPPVDLGELTLVCVASEELSLGEIPYREPGFYERTAGVVTLPAERALTATELQTLAAHPLAIARAGVPAITEPPGSVHVRADRYVFRLDPGQTASARLFATRFGAPYADATIRAIFDPGQLQGGNGVPDVATPADAISFPATVVAGADGVATLPIAARDPSNPRDYIDGQVYGVRPVLAETLDVGVDYPFNQWEFITVLVWDAFEPDDPPTWTGSLQPIFQQYANLYPVMDRFLDLGDYESVCANRDLLLLAFGLDADNANSMPVTRDLSSAKREAILRWLKNPGPDGKPLLGDVTKPLGPSADAVQRAPVAPDDLELRGGKAAAAARRVVLRSHPG